MDDKYFGSANILLFSNGMQFVMRKNIHIPNVNKSNTKTWKYGIK